MPAYAPTFMNADGLECPLCGYHCMHLIRTDIYERRGDDKAKGFHVRSQGFCLTTDTCLDDNPSRRRGAVQLRFDCEACSGQPILNIVQHKGQTTIGWADAETETPA